MAKPPRRCRWAIKGNTRAPEAVDASGGTSAGKIAYFSLTAARLLALQPRLEKRNGRN